MMRQAPNHVTQHNRASLLKRFLCQLILVTTLFGCQQVGQPQLAVIPVPPPEPLVVKFAGIAFLGDWSQRQNRYPITAAVLKHSGEDGTSDVDEHLRAAIQHVKNSNVTLDFSLGDHRSTDAIAVAFAISNERISSQQYQGKFLVSYEISANILTYDFSEAKVIGSYPITVRYAELLLSRPSIERQRKIISAMFLDPNFEANVLYTLVRAFNKIVLRRSYKNYIQITDVTLHKDAVSQLDEMKIDKAAYTQTIAQNFESFLSVNQAVPILPFTKGEAIGAQMSARFSNGEVFNLQLPPPDYEIKITLLPFRKKNVNEANYIQTVYGGNINILVSQPDSGRVYLDGNFWKTAILTQAREDDITIRDWDEYDKVLINLLDELTQQISTRDSTWLGETTRTPNAQEQLRHFDEILARIR